MTLMVAMVFLLVIAMVTMSSLRMSMGGLRAAVNEELRVDAFQGAQSLIDATLAEPLNTAVLGDVGDTNCLPGMAACTRNDLAIESFDGADTEGIGVLVRRLAPEFSPPPRSADYSAVKFRAAEFQVESEFDQTGKGWGRDRLNEGVAVIVPAPGG